MLDIDGWSKSYRSVWLSPPGAAVTTEAQNDGLVGLMLYSQSCVWTAVVDVLRYAKIACWCCKSECFVGRCCRDCPFPPCNATVIHYMVHYEVNVTNAFVPISVFCGGSRSCYDQKLFAFSCVEITAAQWRAVATRSTTSSSALAKYQSGKPGTPSCWWKTKRFFFFRDPLLVPLVA